MTKEPDRYKIIVLYVKLNNANGNDDNAGNVPHFVVALRDANIEAIQHVIKGVFKCLR